MMKYSPEFLEKLDKANLRTQFARIILLSFDKEETIKEIQGRITAGSLNVNGSSAVRRTINLTMIADASSSGIKSWKDSNVSDLENLNNDIAINKKVRVEVGYVNPVNDSEYDDIIWFPCGTFILTTASVVRSTSSWNISITGKDKMCMLDGTCGGTLPASTTFSEQWIQKDDGDITIEYPTIFKIIYEAVHHFGGEPAENIIISDLDEKAKLLVKYVGESPIYFSKDFSSINFVSSASFPVENRISYGEDAGYQETDFTWPGKLILNGGDTVVTLLNKVVSLLGNYEFFYDLDGRFRFQQIKNYLNTGSPLNELEPETYVKSYNNEKAEYQFSTLDSTTQISRSPNFGNIKNDFYVWGERTTAAGAQVKIRYHLAVDTKPRIDLANRDMWLVYSEEKSDNIYIKYVYSDADRRAAEAQGYKTRKVGIPCSEWREELYRRALVAQVSNSEDDPYYDSELLAEWRKLYDPMNETWHKSYNNWNPDVMYNPEVLDFWLDFIDSSSAIGEYSVKQIGRRTKLVNDNNTKIIYNKEVPDVIFFEGYNADLIAKYQALGQRYFILAPEYYNLFSASATGASCFDKIRELLYQHLTYNTTIQITCLPRYYLEPNTIVRVDDEKSNIHGNFQITQFSLPLAYNGTMSITATQVLTRV